MVHAKCENLQNVIIILKNAEKDFNYTRSDWGDLLIAAFSYYFLIQMRLISYFRSMNNCKAIAEGKCYQSYSNPLKISKGNLNIYHGQIFS